MVGKLGANVMTATSSTQAIWVAVDFLATQMLWLPEGSCERIEELYFTLVGTMKTTLPENPAEDRSNNKTRLASIAISLAKRTRDGKTNATHLTRIIKRVFEIDPSLKPGFRHMLLQLTRRLPTDQPRGFGELLLLVRAD